MSRKPKLCDYIKVNGGCCGAFQIKNSNYCYFHERTRRRQERRLKLGGPTSAIGNTGIKFDPIEDANSLLLANNEVLYALMDQRIDSKRASLMLYSLQISANIMSQVKMTKDDPDHYGNALPEEDEEDETPLSADQPGREFSPASVAPAGPLLLASGDSSL